MQANEFEKQVQKQMDDFQLSPSASVWEKVEEQLRKKKRRRVIFFILLPLALGLLGYIGYYLYTDQKAESSTGPIAAKNEKSLITDKKETTTEENKKEQIITPESKKEDKPGDIAKKEMTQKQTTSNIRGNKSQVSSNEPSANHIKNKPVKDVDIIKQDNKITTAQKKNDPSPVIDYKAVIRQDVPVINDKPVTGIDAKNTIDKNPVKQTTLKKDSVIVKDTVSVKTDSINAKNIVEADNNNKENVAKKKITDGKLKWGIDFSAGITSSQSSVFTMGRALDRFTYSTNPGSSAGSAAVLPPSSIRPGFSFRIGVTSEIKVSERSRFSTGLQYSYTSNRIKTGSEVDTSLRVQSNNNLSSTVVDRLYRGTHQNDYTNSYHFISIPLWYHWQINKKIPLQWNIGMSFSYLLTTNALTYSSSYGGVYYSDKNAVNKAHFNIGAGLSYRFKKKNGAEWVLGPELSFDMRQLMNNRNDKTQYLLFSGINTKFFFPKKKK